MVSSDGKAGETRREQKSIHSFAIYGVLMKQKRS